MFDFNIAFRQRKRLINALKPKKLQLMILNFAPYPLKQKNYFIRNRDSGISSSTFKNTRQ